MGSLVYFAESIEKLGENLAEVRPTLFMGVPRVWEKIQAKMMAAGANAPPIRKKLVAWARKTGLAGGFAEQRGEKKPLLYPIAKKIVFDKVRQRLGLDRARICVTSAAPISRDTLEFFLALGIPLLEVYGMSECTGPGHLLAARALSHRQVRRVPARRRDQDRRGRRDLHARKARLQGLPEGSRGDAQRARRRRLAALRRHRHDRRRGLPPDHRSQEGPPHHGRRREHRAAGARGAPQGHPGRRAGGRHRRSSQVPRRARHARPRARDDRGGARRSARAQTSTRPRSATCSASTSRSRSTPSTRSSRAFRPSSASRSSPTGVHHRRRRADARR